MALQEFPNQCYKLMKCPLDIASEMTPFHEMRGHDGWIDLHEPKWREAYARWELYAERGD